MESGLYQRARETSTGSFCIELSWIWKLLCIQARSTYGVMRLDRGRCDSGFIATGLKCASLGQEKLSVLHTFSSRPQSYVSSEDCFLYVTLVTCLNLYCVLSVSFLLPLLLLLALSNCFHYYRWTTCWPSFRWCCSCFCLYFPCPWTRRTASVPSAGGAIWKYRGTGMLFS